MYNQKNLVLTPFIAGVYLGFGLLTAALEKWEHFPLDAHSFQVSALQQSITQDAVSADELGISSELIIMFI